MKFRHSPWSRGCGHVAVATVCANVLSLTLPVVLMQVYDRVLPGQNLTTLTALMIGLGGAVVLEFVLRLAQTRMLSTRRCLEEVDLARRLHHRLLSDDLAEVEQVSFAGYMHRLGALESVNSTRQGSGTSAGIDLTFAALFVLVICLIALPVGAVVAATLALALISTRRLGGQRQDFTERRADTDARRTAFLVQVFSSAETIKCLGVMPYLERRYDRLVARNASLTATLAEKSALIQGINATVAFSTPILAAAAGAAQVIAGQLSVGGLAASILLSSRAVQLVMRLAEEGDGRPAAAEDRAAETKPACDRPARPALPGTGPVAALRAEGLAMPAVRDRARLFAGADLLVRRGEAVALRGPVSCGKTALVTMLAGHLRPDAGRVRLNDIDIAEIAPAELRRDLAYLPQQHSLLEGTLIDNMTRFQPDLYHDQALELAEELGLTAFLDGHHSGLATPVRRGATLGLPSAMVALVSLIASLVGNPSVILFDEANLALDAKSDRRLRDHLANRKSGTAMLIVSQRPSYLSLCDRGYRFDNGRLVDDDLSDILQAPPARPAPLLLQQAARC